MNQIVTNRMEQINQQLRKEGLEVVLQENFKNNQVRQGLAVRSPEFNCTPVLYQEEDFWDQSDEEIINYLKQEFQEHSFNMKTKDFLNKKFIRSRVLPKMFSDSNIPAMQEKGIEFLHVLDMAVCFYIPIQEDLQGQASVTVTKAVLNELDLPLEEVVMAAKENAARDCCIDPMADLIKESGVDVGKLEMDKTPSMLVVSNHTRIHGAGMIFSEKVLQKVSAFLGNQFAVLPSSVHECICLPYESKNDLIAFQTMVCEVNATQVSLQDKLTDSVYYYRNNKLYLFCKHE